MPTDHAIPTQTNESVKNGPQEMTYIHTNPSDNDYTTQIQRTDAINQADNKSPTSIIMADKFLPVINSSPQQAMVLQHKLTR
ncbi:hypothetical protein AjGTCBM29_02218 [Aeromonas jandaei]|nr:hypothetical protein AjGTCBM29_02218 [Aeromonas jandaei]